MSDDNQGLISYLIHAVTDAVVRSPWSSIYFTAETLSDYIAREKDQFTDSCLDEPEDLSPSAILSAFPELLLSLSISESSDFNISGNFIVNDDSEELDIQSSITIIPRAINIDDVVSEEDEGDGLEEEEDD